MHRRIPYVYWFSYLLLQSKPLHSLAVQTTKFFVLLPLYVRNLVRTQLLSSLVLGFQVR